MAILYENEFSAKEGNGSTVFVFKNFVFPNKRPSPSAHSRSNLTKLRFVVLIPYSSIFNLAFWLKLKMEDIGVPTAIFSELFFLVARD